MKIDHVIIGRLPSRWQSWRVAAAFVIAAIAMLVYTVFSQPQHFNFPGFVSLERYPDAHVTEIGVHPVAGRHLIRIEKHDDGDRIFFESENWADIELSRLWDRSFGDVVFESEVLTNARGESLLLNHQNGVLRKVDGTVVPFQFAPVKEDRRGFAYCLDAEWTDTELFVLYCFPQRGDSRDRWLARYVIDESSIPNMGLEPTDLTAVDHTNLLYVETSKSAQPICLGRDDNWSIHDDALSVHLPNEVSLPIPWDEISEDDSHFVEYCRPKSSEGRRRVFVRYVYERGPASLIEVI